MSSAPPANDAGETLDALIAQFYRAGLQVPAERYRHWLLAQLMAAIPCDAALWGSGSVSQRRFHTVTLIGLPAQFPQALVDTTPINPVVPQLMQRLGTPIDMAEVMPDAEFYASDLYRRAFAPQGIERILSTAWLDPRSGLYSLLSLYRRDRGRRFDADEQARQKRLVRHVHAAASHAFFLHLALTRANRPAQAVCAVIDAHGIFHEAEPRFIELLDARAPERPPQHLPVPTPAAGSTIDFHDLKLRCEPLGDRFLLTLWQAGPLDRLTAREREVVLAVAKGLSFKQAAKKIGVAPSTVANHLYRIYRKLGINNRTDLAALVHPEAGDA